MLVNILRKRYRLRFSSRMKKNHGLCEDPKSPPSKRDMVIDSRLSGQKKLEILLHEMLHACHWQIDEKFVTQAAKDMARILTRLGYEERG